MGEVARKYGFYGEDPAEKRTAEVDHEKLAKLKEAFKTFDKNGDGVVSLEEFKTVMCKMGDKMAEEDAEAIFKDCDVNGNGVLGMEEFAVFMSEIGRASCRERV